MTPPSRTRESSRPSRWPGTKSTKTASNASPGFSFRSRHPTLERGPEISRVHRAAPHGRAFAYRHLGHEARRARRHSRPVARCADRYAIIRSVHHNATTHEAAEATMLPPDLAAHDRMAIIDMYRSGFDENTWDVHGWRPC